MNFFIINPPKIFDEPKSGASPQPQNMSNLERTKKSLRIFKTIHSFVKTVEFFAEFRFFGDAPG